MSNIVNELKEVIYKNIVGIDEKDIFDGEENYITTKVTLILNEEDNSVVLFEDILSAIFSQKIKVEFY